MYLIVVYDMASPKRGNKLLKYLRSALTWIQNSVFEGEVTDSGYTILISNIKKLINKEKDSVIIYKFDSKKYTDRKLIGIEKNSTDTFI